VTVPGRRDGVNRRAEIHMSPAEVETFLHEARTMALCTINHDGTVHAVAMWFGFLEGAIAIETKAKSQKAVNLRRDPRVTCLVEAGETYDELRGVELVGEMELVTDEPRMFELGRSVYERYVGPYREDTDRAALEAMLHKRVVAKLHVRRTVTWDHRKLAAPR
jgi:PPOX class probable F420-dependent enzyme